MDLDTLLAEAAPARHLPLDGPDSPAAVRLYQRITQRPAPSRSLRHSRRTMSALAGVAAAAVAAAVALALGPPAPARHASHGATLAAWTVIPERHGLIKVTIRDLRDPAGLQQTLREHGVPANVRFLSHDFMATTSPSAIPKACRAPRMSAEANAKLQEKVTPGIPFMKDGVVLNIRPSAFPHGIGLFLEAWAASPGTQSGRFLTMQTNLVQATPECTGS
jgi:hypothetical protein